MFIVIFFSAKDNERKDTWQYQFVSYKTDLSVKEYTMRWLFTDLFYKRCWKLEYIWFLVSKSYNNIQKSYCLWNLPHNY